MSKFRVGDLVKGTFDDVYGITNTRMTKGRVVEILSDARFTVEVEEHDCDSYVGHEYDVDEQYFELVSPVFTKNLVYCTFGSDKNYTYVSPVALKKGDKVYVDTTAGNKRHVTVSADSVGVTDEFYEIFLKEKGLGSLKNVIGFYKEVTTSEFVPFK